jgi:hypothetical protein
MRQQLESNATTNAPVRANELTDGEWRVSLADLTRSMITNLKGLADTVQQLFPSSNDDGVVKNRYSISKNLMLYVNV